MSGEEPKLNAEANAEAEAQRPIWPAMVRGWKCRCPACGEGAMLKSFLKVRDTCPKCGEELFHQRADDGPAYLTIVIVGHLLVPVMLLMWEHWDPDPVIAGIVLSLGCIALSLYLLPRIKGAFIGLQWSRRMHGFGGNERG